MEPKKIVTRDEEAQIQAAIIKELRNLEWFVKETHGNMYSHGWPDLFACHVRYGSRWIEVKKPKGYQFTPAQLEWFPQFEAHGCKIWVATTHVGIQQLLMKPAQWWTFLNKTRGIS